MQNSSRLALYHCWIAFAVFLPAVALGAWQMLMRSPLPAPLDDPNAYYTSVTLHGTAMAYVITTFFAMGFGYAVTATSLGRPVRGVTAAWIGFVICVVRPRACGMRTKRSSMMTPLAAHAHRIAVAVIANMASGTGWPGLSRFHADIL